MSASCQDLATKVNLAEALAQRNIPLIGSTRKLRRSVDCIDTGEEIITLEGSRNDFTLGELL